MDWKSDDPCVVIIITMMMIIISREGTFFLQTTTKIDAERDRQRQCQTDRQTDRQRQSERERQTDRNRPTERQSEREKTSVKCIYPLLKDIKQIASQFCKERNDPLKKQNKKTIFNAFPRHTVQFK